MTSTSLMRLLGPPLFLVLFLAIWQGAVVAFKIPSFLLPSPFEVFHEALASQAKILSALAVTATASTLGLLISFAVSQIISVIFALSPLVRMSCYPYAILLQTVPIVAMAPIIITWFGYGFPSVVIVASVISLFPMVTATTNGLLAVDLELIELFRLYRAQWWQVLLKLRYPAATRFIITGLKTSCGLAVVGAIVGEYFVGVTTGKQGLGYYIFVTGQQMKTSLLYVTVLASTLLGVTYFGAINLLANTLLKRYYDPTSLK